MKILLVNSSDTEGGATRAMYRLHQGLQQQANAHLLVQTKRSSDRAVSGAPAGSGKAQILEGLRLTLDALPLQRYRQRGGSTFSLQWLPDTIPKQVARFNPDVVNLHWIHNGLMRLETLAQLPQPLIWTLHDMWAFTGGCHYDQGCARYAQTCGACPQLGSLRSHDLSRWVWQRKAKAWKSLNLTIVAPSRWLGDSAKSSALLRDRRIECIPYGIDTEVYQPIDRATARQLLHLPLDKRLVLFGALSATADKRKGFHLLLPALQALGQLGWQDNLELVIFGATRPATVPDFGFPSHYLGLLHDDLSLALLYSAADVFVAPSTQDNLPNTVLEAIACGVPCVAFAIGGMPDLIDHQRQGYLAQPYQVDDLARGLHWVLADAERHRLLSQAARQKALQAFTLDRQASRYLSLFSDLVS
jgi:glycosyltransferase involved in cell wall biosynthesis